MAKHETDLTQEVLQKAMYGAALCSATGYMGTGRYE